MFLAWAILNDLHGELHREHSVDGVEALRRREITGRDFLEKDCDTKFWEEDLNELGNEFADWYYRAEDGYLRDYEAALGRGLPSLYHVADTWENYDKLEPFLTKRFQEWQRRRR